MFTECKWMISGISLNLLVTQLLICKEGENVSSSTSFGVDVYQRDCEEELSQIKCCVTLT